VTYSDVDRLLATSSPAGFAHVTSEGRWVPYEHLVLLNDWLMRVAAGEVKRLIVTMPPRHGKSETISRYLPAWYLGRFPDRQVMLASYEATFAASWGAKARDLLEAYGPSLFNVRVSDSSSAKDEWRIDGHEGVMVTAGVGGGITGKGAHLLIIDDPVKNAEDAQSATMHRKAWDWWVSTARSRLMPASKEHPAGSVIVVMTRWHEKDLAGQMLEAEKAGGDEWEVLNLPAIAEDNDVLGREVGASLCPELVTEAEWEKTRKASGSYWWSAMYQQRPSPAAGMLFKREHFRYWSMTQNADGQPFIRLHALDGTSKSFDIGTCTKFQTADIAASEKKTADYTVVTTFLRTPDSDLIVWDVAARRFDLLEVPSFIEGRWVAQDRPPLHVEKFGHGFGVVKTLRNRGIPVHDLQPVTDKVTRAMDAVARYEDNSVYHPQNAPWLDALEAELLAFPNGAHDDMVDTISYGAIKLPTISSDDWKPIVKTRPGSRTRRRRAA
jgi:predicted phage terminase large subunit-like protein